LLVAAVVAAAAAAAAAAVEEIFLNRQNTEIQCESKKNKTLYSC